MKNNSEALIIFARKPQLGKVKTRLAAGVGNEKALEIYRRLLDHTRQIVSSVPCDRYVFLTEAPDDNYWKDFETAIQEGDSLGKRMQYAFTKLFSEGYKKILIIGSDCLELNTEILLKAFEELANKDVVIGPAADGGYYLLGMRQLLPKLFSGKEWSTSNVFEETLKDIKYFQHSFATLPVLSDIDNVDDLPKDWLD